MLVRSVDVCLVVGPKCYEQEVDTAWLVHRPGAVEVVEDDD